MFVTREERQPLGGFFTFLLPMCVFGIAALATQQRELTLVAVSLLYLWRPNRAVSSVIGAVIVAAIVAGQFRLLDLTPFASEAVAVFLSWMCLLVLAGAATDDPDSKLELPPAWRHVFPRLVSLPLMIFVVTVFVALFSVMGAAIFRVSSSFTSVDAGAILQSLFVRGAMQSPVYLGVFGAFLGLVVAFIRYQRSLVGSVRYALLLASRYVLPVLCVIALTLFLTMLGNVNYTDEMRISACFAMAVILVINIGLVFADGSLPKPPAWIGVPMIASVLLVSILLWPQFNLARQFFSDETNARDHSSALLYFIMTVGAAAVLAIGVVSDFVGNSRRWMPALPPLAVGLIMLISIVPLIFGLIMQVTGN